MSHRWLALSVVAVLGCGGDDGDGGTVTCDVVPACAAEAISALEACVPMPALMLGTPTNNSGVVDNLRCTGGDLTIAFSTFSFSSGGTVPLPSSVTLTTTGAACAVVKSGTGTRTDREGNSSMFDFATIERLGGDPVTINHYDTGAIGIECGTEEEVFASAGALNSCAASVRAPRMTRDASITMMNMQLLDAAGARTDLFSCTR